MEDFYAKVTPEEVYQWQTYHHTNSDEFMEWHKAESEKQKSIKMTGKEKVAIAMAALGVKDVKKEDK